MDQGGSHDGMGPQIYRVVEGSRQWDHEILVESDIHDGHHHSSRVEGDFYHDSHHPLPCEDCILERVHDDHSHLDKVVDQVIESGVDREECPVESKNG